jgi:hypothetical protein
MTTAWYSLYLSCANSDTGMVERTAAALRDSLSTLGYELYDPFALLPGKAYPQTVRLFVAPVVTGWLRVIGAPDARQLPALSRLGLCLSVALDGTQAQIDVYQDAAHTEAVAALRPYLRAGRSAADLQHIFTTSTDAGKTSVASDALPLALLPEDVQSMAGQVNMRQAQKMFNRLSGNFLKRDQSTAARELVSGGPDWNSTGGQRIRALMHCLTVPDNWREPDFVTLRDAYQLYARQRRNPNARLYPGDAETMTKVPDALDYVPVYGGLNA